MVVIYANGEVRNYFIFYSFSEYLEKKCPFYKELHQIFAEKRSVNTVHVIESSTHNAEDLIESLENTSVAADEVVICDQYIPVNDMEVGVFSRESQQVAEDDAPEGVGQEIAQGYVEIQSRFVENENHFGDISNQSRPTSTSRLLNHDLASSSRDNGDSFGSNVETSFYGVNANVRRAMNNRSSSNSPSGAMMTRFAPQNSGNQTPTGISSPSSDIYDSPAACDFEETRTQRKRRNNQGGSLAMMVELQEKRLKLEEQRLENENSLKKAELDNNLTLKKMELESKERIELARIKAEFDMAERVKKYELELNLRHAE